MENNAKFLSEVFKRTAVSLREDKDLSANKKDLMLNLLKNEYGHVKRLTENAVTMSNVTTTATYALPIVKKTFPKTIADKILSVQTINAPIAIVRYLRYVRATNKGVNAAGDVVPENIMGNSKGYSPFYASDVQMIRLVVGTNGAGAIASVAYAAGGAFANYHPLANSVLTDKTVVIESSNVYKGDILVSTAFTYASPSTMAITLDAGGTNGVLTVTFDGTTAPAITAAGAGFDASKTYYIEVEVPFEIEDTQLTSEDKFQVTQITMEAKIRQLKAAISLESLLTGNKIGIEGDRELIDVISAELAVEVDRFALRTIWKSALSSPVTVKTMDAGAPTSAATNIYTDAFSFYSHLLRPLNQQRFDIYKKSFRGPGNFLVTGPDVLSVLMLSGLLSDDGMKALENGHIGDAGTLAKTWNLFADVVFPPGEILQGYRSKTRELDAGAVMGIFIPLVMTPAQFKIDNFSFNYGVFTSIGCSVYDNTVYGRVLVNNL